MLSLGVLMKHKLQIVPNSAYLRSRKFTSCQYCYWTPDECHDSVL